MAKQAKIGNITSSNATLILTVDDLFPNGIQLEQAGTDQFWNMDSIQLMENRIGVDGKMVGGYLPSIKTVTITLEASSPSFDALAEIFTATGETKNIYNCTLVADIPSVGKSYIWSSGAMKSGTPVPNGGKVLGSTTWTFDFAELSVTKSAD